MNKPYESPSHSDPLLSVREILWLGGIMLAASGALLLSGRARLLAIEGLCFIPPAMAAGLGLARIRKDSGMRWSWAALSLAMALQAASHIIRLRWEIRGVPFPAFPTLADGLQLSVLPLLLFTLATWPAGNRSPGWRRRCIMDAFVFMGSLLFLFWQLGLREAARFTGPDPVAVTAYFGSSFLAILAFGYWVYLVVPGRSLPSRPLIWLGLLMLGGSFVNMAQLLAGLSNTYAPGHWSDAATASVLSLVVPALWARSPAQAAAVREDEGQNVYLALLPYLPILPSIGLVGWQIAFRPALLDWRAMALGLPVIILLLARQFLALKDVHTLTAGLELKVQERTRALESAQDLLLQTQRMNSIAVLGASLAHDLKNLIGVVTNYALLMRQDIQEGRGGDLDDLEAIRAAAVQAGVLAHQLMAFGREDEGIAVRGTYDLCERVRALTSLLRAILPLPITLKVSTSEEPLHLRGDSRHFDQMLTNLVLNARDALHGRGSVSVAVCRITLANGRPAAQLEVRDTGCGMSKETMSRLFEPFFTTKSPGKGTGLGLASIRAIVDRGGGEIETASQVGEGTIFRVRMPLAESGVHVMLA